MVVCTCPAFGHGIALENGIEFQCAPCRCWQRAGAGRKPYWSGDLESARETRLAGAVGRLSSTDQFAILAGLKAELNRFVYIWSKILLLPSAERC
jgi:hypothetical protein